MSSFPNVTVDAKANIYFDGRVVSHSVHFPDGSGMYPSIHASQTIAAIKTISP